MHADDLLLHDRDEGQAVEAVVEELPQLDVVAPLALVVEAVDPVDRRALVVAAEQEEVLGVLHLVREEQRDRVDAVLPAVDVVAEEEVVGVGREAAILKEAEQVGELAVDVADDLDRRLELEERGLGLEDLHRRVHEERQLGRREPGDALLLRRRAEELRDYLVDLLGHGELSEAATALRRANSAPERRRRREPLCEGRTPPSAA